MLILEACFSWIAFDNYCWGEAASHTATTVF